MKQKHLEFLIFIKNNNHDHTKITESPFQYYMPSLPKKAMRNLLASQIVFILGIAILISSAKRLINRKRCHTLRSTKVTPVLLSWNRLQKALFLILFIHLNESLKLGGKTKKIP